jgi:hypothetical protein
MAIRNVTSQIRTKQIACHYCNGTHSCRNCPIEALIAPEMKKIVGQHMETFVAQELCCPRCNNMTLGRIGNHSPSLDIICSNCSTNFEVKSKCISAETIPNDLILNHGNYFDYIARQSRGLDFIIIIYGVDRRSKIITIRKVLHVPHNTILQKKAFKVIQKTTSPLSDIIIPNHNDLDDITPTLDFGYDFSDNIIALVNEAKSR